MLYEQSRLEVERLERSLASMRAVSARVDAPETRLIEASVIASDPSRRTGVLALNAGERHGVRAGAAALTEVSGGGAGVATRLLRSLCDSNSTVTSCWVTPSRPRPAPSSRRAC
jgi:hypothetical protein